MGNQRGIIRFLGDDADFDHLLPIEEIEMRPILFLTRGGNIVKFSQFYKIGQKVRVINGPLEGLEGIIRRVNPRKKRITVSLRMLGVERLIDLGGERLTEIE
ncbi:MAG: KOW motif-containing protein [Oligoflexia bacterium]|nr:KOW motif-containing protein [Oligoflexia bacterium]